MRVRVLVLTAILVVSGGAAAQEASTELVAEDPPAAQEIQAGESVAVTFSANFTISGTSCSGSVEVPGNATGEASVQGSAPSGASNTVEAGELAFTVPDGDHGTTPAGEAYSEAQPATVTLSTEGGLTENYTVSLSLSAATAEVDASPTCLPGTFPAAETGSVSVTVDVIRDQQPADDDVDGDDGTDGTDGTDGGNGTDGTDGTDGGADGGDGDEENGTPLGPALAPLAAGAAALMRRRR